MVSPRRLGNGRMVQCFTYCFIQNYTVPTGAPLFVSSQALSPSVLLIQWEPPNMEQQNGVIRRYVINITEIETTTSKMFYSNETNITLDSRHPFYQYSYSVSAVTFRPGPFSSIDVIQMPEAGIVTPDIKMFVVYNNYLCV